MKFLLGLDYNTWCCDGCAHATPVCLEEHLPGPIWKDQSDLKRKRDDQEEDGDVTDLEVDEVDEGDSLPGHSRVKRKGAHRKPLVERLLRWRFTEHEQDPLRDVWPEHLIITNASIATLSSIHPINLKSSEDVMKAIT